MIGGQREEEKESDRERVTVTSGEGNCHCHDSKNTLYSGGVRAKMKTAGLHLLYSEFFRLL